MQPDMLWPFSVLPNEKKFIPKTAFSRTRLNPGFQWIEMKMLNFGGQISQKTKGVIIWFKYSFSIKIPKNVVNEQLALACKTKIIMEEKKKKDLWRRSNRPYYEIRDKYIFRPTLTHFFKKLIIITDLKQRIWIGFSAKFLLFRFGV